MAPVDHRPELVGLAAALDALFERHAFGQGAAEPRQEAVTSDAERTDRSLDVPPEPVGELKRAVARVIGGEDHAADRVRSAVRGLERGGHLEPVVDAVLRLASPVLEGPGSEGSLALARELAVAGVADRLAARLGAVRDADRRSELTASIVRLGSPMAVAIGEALMQTEDRGARHALTSALAGMGEKASDVLGALVRDHRWFVVRNAALVLGEIREPSALPHLTRTLAHPDPRVRRETLIALARIGGEAAAKLVSGMLADPEPNVREAAALAAGTLGARAAVEPLLATIRDGDDPGVEVAALRALGRLGAEAWVPDLERKAKGAFLYRPPVEVRLAAYRALATVDAPEARNVLRRGLHDRDEAVRTAVQELLRTAPPAPH